MYPTKPIACWGELVESHREREPLGGRRAQNDTSLNICAKSKNKHSQPKTDGLCRANAQPVVRSLGEEMLPTRVGPLGIENELRSDAPSVQ